MDNSIQFIMVNLSEAVINSEFRTCDIIKCKIIFKKHIFFNTTSKIYHITYQQHTLVNRPEIQHFFNKNPK